MIFGSYPFGSSAFGSRIISFVQTIEEINRFENAQVFYAADIIIFHRHYSKCEIDVMSPEVDITVSSPSIEITVI